MRTVNFVRSLDATTIETSVSDISEVPRAVYCLISGEVKGKLIAVLPDELCGILAEELIDPEKEGTNDPHGPQRAAAAEFLKALSGIFANQLHRAKIEIKLRPPLHANELKDLPGLLKESSKRWLMEFETDELRVFVCLLV